MDQKSRRVAVGCGLAAAIATFGILLLAAVALIGGLFVVRSSSSSGSGPVGQQANGADFSAEFADGAGSMLNLWADTDGNCIGISIEGEESAACRDDGPVIDELVAGGQRWAVSLSEVGVALEPTDHQCSERLEDIHNGHNLYWCRLP